MCCYIIVNCWSQGYLRAGVRELSLHPTLRCAPDKSIPHLTLCSRHHVRSELVDFERTWWRGRPPRGSSRRSSSSAIPLSCSPISGRAALCSAQRKSWRRWRIPLASCNCRVFSATTQRGQCGISNPPCSAADLPSIRSRPRCPPAPDAKRATGPPQEDSAIPQRQKSPR
jgi:hypothetical protein